MTPADKNQTITQTVEAINTPEAKFKIRDRIVRLTKNPSALSDSTWNRVIDGTAGPLSTAAVILAAELEGLLPV